MEHGGKVYEAEYFVDRGVITVCGERGQESTQIGGAGEQLVAKLLLNNLIRKGQIDPAN
ncbi:hypothetical protein [Stenotrophomonas sp. Nf1]|nr:hypothetical protein [Stenotrophomonas sp. Nf1]